MRIIILMRQTEDWENVTWETLDPPWTDVSKMDLKYRCPWDKAFGVSYFEYRRRLKEIAMSSWPFDFVNYLDPIKKMGIGDNDLVVPTDDDDWFGPDLEEFLLNSVDDFIMWDSIVNKTAYDFNLCTHCDFNSSYPLASNGYAIRGSVVKRISSKQRWKILMSHNHSKRIAEELGCSIMDRRDLVLSLYNWHMGSFSALVHLGDPLMIRKLLPKNNPKILPDKWKWADPQYSQVIDLVQSL